MQHEKQSARAVLMIRPKHFAANPDTASSNRFQSQAEGGADVADAARGEADALANALADAGIAVHVLEGRDDPACADELFPNNWLSTHSDGTLVLYPMMAPSRRRERRPDVDDALRKLGYVVGRVVDLTELEALDLFVEGTGSLVLDRSNRIAYACASDRTTPAAVRVFADRLGYAPVVLDARDRAGRSIYHTNVLMSVGESFAVVCAEAVRDEGEREALRKRLRSSGKEIVEIDYEQLYAFAGNLLQLRSESGPVIALSQTALDSLAAKQRRALAGHGELLPVAIDTVETHGGGSVRCMLAEIHLGKSAFAQ